MPLNVGREIIALSAPFQTNANTVRATTDGHLIYITDGYTLYSYNPVTRTYTLLVNWPTQTTNGTAIAYYNGKIFRCKEYAQVHIKYTTATTLHFDVYDLSTQRVTVDAYSVAIPGLAISGAYTDTTLNSKTPTTGFIGNKWVLNFGFLYGSWLNTWDAHHERTVIFDLENETLSVVSWNGTNTAEGSVIPEGNSSNCNILGRGGRWYDSAPAAYGDYYWTTLLSELNDDGTIRRLYGNIGYDSNTCIIKDSENGFYTIGGRRKRTTSPDRTTILPDWQNSIIYMDMLRNVETVLFDSMPARGYAACLLGEDVYVFGRDEIWRIFPSDARLDLTTLVPQLSVGTHTIKARASATGFEDSDYSNSIQYTVYGVEGSINNGSLVGASKIGEYQTITLTIVPDEGYIVPVDLESISIVGATQASYDGATGELTIGNPAGTVQITATCPVGA